MAIKTTSKKNKQASLEQFLSGADTDERIDLKQTLTANKVANGVKMKNIAIPLDISERLNRYVEQNKKSYSRISSTAIIIQALDEFLIKNEIF